MPGDPVEQKLNTLMATGGGQMGDVTAMADAYRERFGLKPAALEAVHQLLVGHPPL